MIPTPQQLEEISLRREGKLAETPFSFLLLAHATHLRTAVVEVRRKQVAKKIVFEQGVPIECRSNLVHETLGRYMVGIGKLPEADLLPYLNQSAARGKPLGEVLLEHGVVGAEELFKLLQQNLAKKLLDIFTWRDGEIRLLPDAPEPDSPLKVRVPQLIVTGITKYSPAAEVEAGVAPLVGKKLTLHPHPRYSLDEIRLGPAQTQVAMALRAGWRMDELAVGTAMPFDELNRLLYALAVLGVVVTAESLSRRPSGATPGAAGPARPEEATRETRPFPAPPPTRLQAVPLSAGVAAASRGTAAAAADPETAAPASLETAAAASFGTAAPATFETAAPASLATAAAAPASAETPAASIGTERVAAAAPGTALAAAPGTALAAAPGTALAAAPGTAAAAAALETSAAAVSAERRNEVVQAYLSHRRQDSFDLLGVPEDTTLGAVEQAFLDFSRRFAPWMLAGPQQESIEEKARALFCAGARAYAELVDTEQRNTLLLRRKTLREQRRGRHAPDAFGIKTDLLDSEAQFRKGKALMEMGKYREAILQLEFAADCDPGNGPYTAELAYCRFLNAPASTAQALGDLQETLRRDPDCGIALYYSGEIHRHVGHKHEAEAFLRRAIKAMSPDRRPIEALKALSAEKRR
jgi:tetratricopeptide (TPR) repeat protein